MQFTHGLGYTRPVDQMLYLKGVISKPIAGEGQKGHPSEAGNRRMNFSRYHCLILLSAAQKEKLQVVKGALGILHAEVTVSHKE